MMRYCKALVQNLAFLLLLLMLGGCGPVNKAPMQIIDKQHIYYGHYFKLTIIKFPKEASLEDIAAKYHVSVDLLAYINNIKYPYTKIPEKIPVPIDAKGERAKVLKGPPAKEARDSKGVKDNKELQQNSGDITKAQPVVEEDEVTAIANKLTSKLKEDEQPLHQDGAEATLKAEKIDEKAINGNDVDEHDEFMDKPQVHYKYRTPLNSPDFVWPLYGKVLRHYSEQPQEFDEGISISAPLNATVRAAAAGKVVYSGFDTNQFGNLVILQHENNYYTAYAHNSTLLVEKGESVLKGQPVGRVGKTGKVTEPQLYFSIRKDNVAIDPEKIPVVSKHKSISKKGSKAKKGKSIAKGQKNDSKKRK